MSGIFSSMATGGVLRAASSILPLGSGVAKMASNCYFALAAGKILLFPFKCIWNVVCFPVTIVKKIIG